MQFSEPPRNFQHRFAQTNGRVAKELTNNGSTNTIIHALLLPSEHY